MAVRPWSACFEWFVSTDTSSTTRTALESFSFSLSFGNDRLVLSFLPLTLFVTLGTGSPKRMLLDRVHFSTFMTVCLSAQPPTSTQALAPLTYIDDNVTGPAGSWHRLASSLWGQPRHQVSKATQITTFSVPSSGCFFLSPTCLPHLLA
ncbi:hypothetical protein LZ32DRAFT_110751 [Colletotrichum eremochloae]|nr:hypothetical protein LZ32DRAFT_110751 [Colletotrichum eremochloae]